MKNPSIVLLAASLLASGAVTAREYSDPGEGSARERIFRLDHGGAPLGAAPSEADRADFDHSGARGRQELGASPYRPDGPGNFSD